jgi:hypothetical protein
MSENLATVESESTAGMTVAEAAKAFESMFAEPGEQTEAKAQTDEAQAESDDVGDVETDAEEQGEGSEDVEASSESDEDAQEQEQSSEPPKFTVKIDGKEQEVELNELINGYQRTADYTRKTQALAEQRKAAEAELNAVREERQTYAQLLTALQQQIQQQQENPIDMESLYRDDPIEWVRQTELQRQRNEKLAASQAELQRLNQLQQAEVQRSMKARLEQEAQLLVEAIPEWKNADTAKSEKAALIEFGLKEGFQEDDLKGVADHRVVKLLRKAMLYDRITAKQATIKPKPPTVQQSKVIAPGNPKSAKVSTSEVVRAKQRLAKTGNVRDAAKLFEHLI